MTAAILGAAAARAQSAAPSSAEDTGDKAAASPSTTGGATPPPKAAHDISPETESLLEARRPKFDPPKPTPPPKPDDQLLDLRDIDKPKNQIIRLPKVVVTEKPPPIFSQREINTKDGLEDIALKTYLVDPRNMSPAAAAAQRMLFGGYALEQYQEQERLNNIASLKDTANMFQGAGDKDEANLLKNVSADTYLQRGDFGTSAPDQPSGSNPFQYQYLNKTDISPSSP